MEVDIGSLDTPALPTILSACVAYPTSYPALRLAIKQCLPDAEHLSCILEVLDGWLSSSCSQDILPGPVHITVNTGRTCVPGRDDRDEMETPPLDKVCPWTFALLLKKCL